MDIQIIEKDFRLQLHGVSGIAINNNWAKTGFELMNEMWKQVKANNLKHKGLNVWVYEGGNRMFAGIELETSPGNTVLETKNISLAKYTYYTHVGSYGQIKETGSKVLDELASRGIKTSLPYIEIYGHWTADETNLETELIWCLE